MSDHTTTDTQYKTCTKCGQTFPATPEYFYRKGTGLKSECAECSRVRTRTKRANEPEWVAAQRAKSREWKAEHKVEVTKYMTQYRMEHYDKLLDDSRKRMRNKYASDPEFRDRAKRRTKEWRKEYPTRKAANHHRRRAKEHELPAEYTGDDWQHALDYFDGCCAVCGRPQGLWHRIAQDHWIPLSYDGDGNPGTVPTNIVPLCHAIKDGFGGCNNSKNDRMPDEWLNTTYGKKKARLIRERIAAYFEWVRESTQ